MTVNIRLATPSDAATLTDIAINAKRSNGYSDSFMDACREELTVTARDISEAEYWVAETDVILGFVCLVMHPEQQRSEIHSFFVDPARQRAGTGSLLWRKIVERVESKNINSIFLDSDPYAVPFYEGLGFAVVAEVPSGSIAGRKIPRMELQIR